MIFLSNVSRFVQRIYCIQLEILRLNMLLIDQPLFKYVKETAQQWEIWKYLLLLLFSNTHHINIMLGSMQLCLLETPTFFDKSLLQLKI